MWWNRKRSKDASSGGGDDAAVVQAPVESPNAHRNAFILIGLGGATIAAFGLAAIAGIFAPFFLGVVLTICVHPLRVWLEKRGVPRGIATAAVIIAVLLLLLGLGYAMLVAFGQFGALLQEFSDQIAAFGQDVAAWLSSIGIGADEVNDIFAGFDPAALAGFVGGLIGGLTGMFSLLVIVLTMLLLMGMDAAFVPTLLKQLYPARPLVVASLVTYGSNVRRYMVATTVLGLAQGIVDWIALLLIGVPGAFIWGLLAFVCSFIPNVGYFIALIPPIIFGALVGGLPTVILVIVVYAIINGVIQSVIQPRVIGKAVNLSQTITFFSVLFWAVVIGPIGAILAIPLTLLVRLILVDSNPAMSWIRPMLGELDETKAVMAQFDAEAKAERKARSVRDGERRSGRAPPGCRLRVRTSHRAYRDRRERRAVWKHIVDDIELLRRLAINDGRLAEADFGFDLDAISASIRRRWHWPGSPPSSRWAAAEPSFGALADAAVNAGATAAEIVDVLVGITNVVGVPRVVAAAPQLAMALGHDLDEGPARTGRHRLAGLGAEEADLGGAEDRLASLRHPELAVDGGELRAHRVARDVEPVGDLADREVRLEVREQSKFGRRQGWAPGPA